MCERSGGLIGRTSWQTVWAQTLVGGLCNEFLGKISCTNNTSLNSRLQFFTICPSTRKLQYRTIPLSTRSCDALQYLSQLEVAMLYNTSLNSKLQYLKIPLSIQSYYALQCLSQLEVTIPYNTGACLTCSSLLLSLCFLVVCPDKKENVFHSDECGEGKLKFYNTLQYLSQLSSIEPTYSFVLSAQDVLHS